MSLIETKEQIEIYLTIAQITAIKLLVQSFKRR